jgi:hypothetical protein
MFESNPVENTLLSAKQMEIKISMHATETDWRPLSRHTEKILMENSIKAL